MHFAISVVITKEGLCAMEKYVFGYKNENEFKMIESTLKKYSMSTFKKLYFEIYPKLKDGEFIGKVVKDKENIKEYVLDLPTYELFAKVYDKIKLHYEVDEYNKVIISSSISPVDILKEGHQSELITYKGVMLSKQHPEIDRFKIDLLEKINNGHHNKWLNL